MTSQQLGLLAIQLLVIQLVMSVGVLSFLGTLLVHNHRMFDKSLLLAAELSEVRNNMELYAEDRNEWRERAEKAERQSALDLIALNKERELRARLQLRIGELDENTCA